MFKVFARPLCESVIHVNQAVGSYAARNITIPPCYLNLKFLDALLDVVSVVLALTDSAQRAAQLLVSKFLAHHVQVEHIAKYAALLACRFFSASSVALLQLVNAILVGCVERRANASFQTFAEKGIREL